MTSTPEPDPALLEAHALALSALREVTPESSMGEPAGYRVEDDGAVSLRFTNRLAGYPGWFWTVSLARVEDAEPTVLEVELLPGDGALLAPEWVPWAVRLADYQAAQTAQAELDGASDDESDEDDDEDDDELDDVDDLDALDFDQDGSPILHSGDVDGVDIDELSEPLDRDDSESDDDDADDDDADDDASDDDDEPAVAHTDDDEPAED